MLENIFAKPSTINRIRNCCLQKLREMLPHGVRKDIGTAVEFGSSNGQPAKNVIPSVI